MYLVPSRAWALLTSLAAANNLTNDALGRGWLLPAAAHNKQTERAAMTDSFSNIPPHVDRKLILPIGIAEGPEFLTRPFEFMAGLHDTHPPIFYTTSDHTYPAWVLIKNPDAFFALRHPEIFSACGSVPFPRDPANFFPMLPVELDPPVHRSYRQLLEPLFTPAAMTRLEQSIRQRTNDLIDRFVGQGCCEFTTDLGRPLPVSVFLDLMGLPQSMRDTFVDWAMGLLHSHSHEVAGQSMAAIGAYLGEVIAEKAAAPDDGVISHIVHGRVDGAPMSPPEVFGYTFFLFIAGLDTVFAALNNIFVWLARHPERRAEIRARSDRMEGVVEELLRAFTVTFAARTLARDYEFNGVQMRKGDRVTCLLPATNYDPQVFERPREIDFDRPRRPNLSFAGGAHSCLGAHLARLEIKVVIGEFLRRIPDFELKPGTRIEYWPGGVVGPKVVPLQWQ